MTSGVVSRESIRLLCQAVEPTESEQLYPISHVDDGALAFIHIVEKDPYSIVNVRLEVFQCFHRVRPTDKPSLLAVQPFVRFGEQVEFPMTLPYRVPLAFPKLRAGTVYRLDGCKIGNTDFVGPSPD